MQLPARPSLSGSTPAQEGPITLQQGMALAAQNRSVEARDSMWVEEPIDGGRWNRLYPYQLLVLQEEDTDHGEAYSVVPSWVHTLSLPPEAVSISMPFAASVEATLGGIVEEHNGAPFRLISLRGSTGFLPMRASANGGGSDGQVVRTVSALLAGTVLQAGRVAAAAEEFGRGLVGVGRTNPNLHLSRDIAEHDTLNKTTGYYQIRALEQFLERYINIKKTRAGSRLRLAMAIWKHQAVYLVTPAVFDVTKDAGSPFEYHYTLTLKAWRRVHVERNRFAFKDDTSAARRPNQFARLLNVMRDAREVLDGVAQLPAAVVGDVERVLNEPVREAVLLMKSAVGAATSLRDAPAQIRQALIANWERAEAQLRTSRLAETTDPRAKALRREGGENDLLRRGLKRVNPTAGGQSLVAPAGDPSRQSGNLLADETPLSSVTLTPAQQAAVAAEAQRVRTLTRTDWERRRDNLERLSREINAGLGLTHPDYDATYEIKRRGTKVPTELDYAVSWALNDVLVVFDALAAAAQTAPTALESSVDIMAGLARRSGIAFVRPVSKFAVPFPAGATLESLAAQYLGDPNRAGEIVALNGLRAPYIDEEGWSTPLLVHGAARTLVVAADAAEKIYPQQAVWVESRRARRLKTRVQGVVPRGDIVEIAVADDVSGYRTDDGAKLVGFLPDTVNSQQLIYIPSEAEPTTDNAITKDIPGVNQFDALVAAGGVDWLLDQNNRLVVAPDGDVRLAIGLTNIVQGLRVELRTTRKSLLLHPEYGFPAAPGQSTADMSAQDIMRSVRRMLGDDPTYTSIDSVSVHKVGGALDVAASVRIAGAEQPIPVAFVAPRGDAAP